jgi:hypothetical protein
LTVSAVLTFVSRFAEDQADQSDFLANLVTTWHENAIKAHEKDYSRTKVNGEILPPKVPGPGCTGRALAMVHLAIYDAYVGISKEDKTYLTYKKTPPDVDAGMCRCLHQTRPCSHCFSNALLLLSMNATICAAAFSARLIKHDCAARKLKHDVSFKLPWYCPCLRTPIRFP